MSRIIPFWKLQSVGNDFPVVHLGEFSDPDRELPALTVRLGDRRFGVGGDGLLAVGMEGPAVRLRMFNPDGTEDFCGNGLRIAARHAFDLGWVSSEFEIRHFGRVVPASVAGTCIRTTLGIADYRPEAIPVQDAHERFRRQVLLGGELETLSSLSTGSAHTVLMVDSLPDDATILRRGPAIEMDPAYPARTSVIWTQVVEPGVLRLRIWERGVGETLGCGTGSSAAAADYVRASGWDGTVEVRNPGGTVWVSMPSWDGPITVEGEAKLVYTAIFRQQ